MSQTRLRNSWRIALGLCTSCFLCLAGAVYFWDSSHGPSPTVSVAESLLDLGVVLENGQREIAFAFRNTGSAPLEMSLGAMSCRCGEIVSFDEYIAPGESGQLIMMFTAPKKRGDVYRPTKMISVNTNDPDNPVLLLHFAANIVRGIETDPAGTIELGDIDPLSAVSGSVVVRQYVGEGKPADLAVESSCPRVETSLIEKSSGSSRLREYELAYRIVPPFDYGMFVETLQIGSETTNERVVKLLEGRVVGDVVAKPSLLYWGVVESGSPVMDIAIRVRINGATENTVLRVHTVPPHVTATIERVGLADWSVSARLDAGNITQDETVRGTIRLAYSNENGGEVGVAIPVRAYMVSG